MLWDIYFKVNRIESKTYVVYQWAGNMNSLESKAKNYLYTSHKNEDNIKDFFQIAVSLVKNGKVVLVFTREHVDFLPMLADLNKDQMQQILVSYNSDINSIIDKLLELHDWTILPDLIILNLNSFFVTAGAVPCFKKVCFCISTLLHYMRSLEKRIVAKQKDPCNEPTSVTLLNAHPDVRIQLLVNLYFYKKASFTDLDAIKQKISIQC